MKQLDRYLKIARKTGSPVIVHDPKGEDVVLLGIEEYEMLLESQEEIMIDEDELEMLEDEDEFDGMEDEMEEEGEPFVIDEEFADEDDDDIDDLLLEAAQDEEDEEEDVDPELESLEESLEEEIDAVDEFASEDDIDHMQAEIAAFEQEQSESEESFAIPVSIPSMESGKGTPKRDEDDWASAGEVLAERFKKLASDDEENFYDDNDADDLDAEGFHYDPTFQEKAQGIPYKEMDEDLNWEEKNDLADIEMENDPVFYEEPV